MTTLYQISDEYVQAFNKLSEEGFDLDTIDNTLSPITKSFEEKAKNVTAWLNNIDSELSILEEHKKNIEERIRTRKKQISFYREYLKNHMIKTDIKSIKCPFFDISIKKSIPKLIIEDVMRIPPEYISTEVIIKTNDQKIKNDIKNGASIPGAYLQETMALTIKT